MDGVRRRVRLGNQVLLSEWPPAPGRTARALPTMIRRTNMTSKKLLQPSLLALALGCGLTVPAAAQVGYGTSTARPMVQGAQLGTPGTGLANWTYDDVYRTGWSAERLMDDAEVIGALGEDIGSVENIIVGRDGRILGIVAQVGGLWDIGDTHVFVPWDQVRVSPTLDRVVVPITEDTVDDYAYASNDVLTRFGATRTQTVDDDLTTGTALWKATDVIDDYAYLSNRRAYGYVNDLIFSTGGRLQAVVVNAGNAWGGGYRAVPFTGYGAGWNPGTSDFQLGYGDADVANLERFDYNRLPSRLTFDRQGGTGAQARATGDRGAVTGAVPTQWTFREIDSDGNLELTSREFARVGGNVYSRWDTNRDARLDQNEFHTGLYNVFDSNRDRRISRDELDRGWSRLGITNQRASYGTFDRDGDGMLDRNEFRTGFDRIGYYDRWDANSDGWLAQNEFNAGLYDAWDMNSDRVVAENEFNTFAGDRGWF
jgi:hypothetical protein